MAKIKIFFNTIWITAIVIVTLSLIWFLLGTTAFFKRGIDLVTTVYYLWIWIPALLFTSISIFLLKKGWFPKSLTVQIGLILVIIILTIFFSKNLFSQVNTEGWLHETSEKDFFQTTKDGKYKYQLELINLFQRNARAQLNVKDLATSEAMVLSIDIKLDDIGAILPRSENETIEEEILLWRWSELNPTDVATVYTLTTINLTSNQEVFEINMTEKTVRKIK